MFEAGRRYSDSPVLGVSLGPVDATVLSTLVSQGFAVNDTSTVTTAPRDDSVHEFVRGPAPLGPLQPTIDPTTGALVDPVTGEIVLGTMSIMAPRVSPLCYGIRRADYTAAAALDAPNGVIGVLDSTPTAAESLAAQINIEFAADEYVWGLEINMPDTTDKLVDGLRIAVQPGDYVAASQILVSTSSLQRIDVASNTSTVYEFRDSENERVYVTAISLVWTPRAGGSGYPAKPLSIRGLADV